MAWDYDRIEIIADGIIHATGISLGLVGAIAIIIVAVDLPRIEITSIVIYILGLVAMLVISGAYNMWPISPTKWILRRFDHSGFICSLRELTCRSWAQAPNHAPPSGTSVHCSDGEQQTLCRCPVAGDS